MEPISINNYKVYEICHNETGMKYIEAGNDPLRRFSEIPRDQNNNSAISTAMRAYGRTAFTLKIYASGLTKEHALNFEKALIDKFKTESPNGYNPKQSKK